MRKSKHEAVWDWLMECPELQDLFFNFGKAENGNTILVPETAYNDTWKDGKANIDGTGIRYYDFAIIQFKAAVFEPNSTENIEILLNVEKVAKWIEEQEMSGNYPDFPEHETVLEVGLSENPGSYVAGQDETGAKYMLQVRIEYFYEKE